MGLITTSHEARIGPSTTRLTGSEGDAVSDHSFPAAASPAAASMRRALRALARRWVLVMARGQAGMSTAEYAVGTVAACAFAAVLYRVVTGGSIVTALGKLITRALETLS
jgi:Protein of unknown function (DUF4244)